MIKCNICGKEENIYQNKQSILPKGWVEDLIVNKDLHLKEIKYYCRDCNSFKILRKYYHCLLSTNK